MIRVGSMFRSLQRFEELEDCVQLRDRCGRVSTYESFVDEVQAACWVQPNVPAGFEG